MLDFASVAIIVASYAFSKVSFLFYNDPRGAALVSNMAADERSDEGLQTGFPRSPSSFDADPRVSFSRLDNKFILETDEGSEFEWDSALKRWIPVVGT